MAKDNRLNKLGHIHEGCGEVNVPVSSISMCPFPSGKQETGNRNVPNSFNCIVLYCLLLPEVVVFVPLVALFAPIGEGVPIPSWLYKQSICSVKARNQPSQPSIYTCPVKPRNPLD
jgi:hypothetical protein